MALSREYAGSIHVSMAKLAANLDPDTEIEIPVSYDETKAATQFVSAFRAQQRTSRLRLYSHGNQVGYSDGWKAIRRPTLLATAAALLVCLGGAFELGRRMTVAPLHSAP